MADDSMDFQYGQVDEEWAIDLDNLNIEEELGGYDAPAADQVGSAQERLLRERDAVDQQVRQVNANNVCPEAREVAGSKKKAKTGQVSHLPPGIKVFSGDPFIYFTHRDLDLVKDFKYRLRHTERGFRSEEHLAEVLASPMHFILHLSPESSSKLVLDNDDFVAICEFLIYSLIGYCPVPDKKADKLKRGPFNEGWLLWDVYRKALFDLIRTYAFKGWKLTIKHLMVGLLNLGANTYLVADQKFYDEALKPSSKYEKKGGFQVTQQWPPFWVEIFKGRPDDDSTAENRTPTLADVRAYLGARDEPLAFTTDQVHGATANPTLKHLQMTGVKNFVELVVDLIIAFFDTKNMKGSKLLPKPQAEGGPCGQICLVLFHLLSTVCMDTHAQLMPSIGYDFHRLFAIWFNQFSTKQFWGCEDMEAKGLHPAIYDIKHLVFTASKHVRANKQVWAFSDKETGDCGVLHFGSDHHHNLVERVRMLPATHRCRQLRRCLALMWLKQMLNFNPASPKDQSQHISLEPSHRADVGMAAMLLEDKRLKLGVLSKNAYLYVSVILLVDQIVGAEPALGKDEDKINRAKTAIERILAVLNDVKRDRELDKEDEDEFLKWKDFYAQFPKKWTQLHLEKRVRRKQTHVSDFFPSLGRAPSRYDLPSSQETDSSQQKQKPSQEMSSQESLPDISATTT